MNCIIPGRGIRAFGKAIYCLAKIGEELYIEALPDGLALKTVNGARSAFASFIFQQSFFHSYRDVTRATCRDLEDDDESEEEPLKCKISIKSCVSVFKALSTLEKTVDRCSFYLDSQHTKLVFVFHCRHGIVKTHNLGFQECEALQAVFTKELCPNQITGPAKVISEVVVNFPTNLDEVTLIAEPESVRLKNYVEEDDSDSNRVSLTEISLAPQEFDDYQIGVDAAITFCLKELRALLVFTDAINHSLSIRFEGPGRPVVFSLDDCDDYKADFVLATLLDGTSPSQPSTSATAAASTMDTQPSSTEQPRRQPRKRTQSGQQRTMNSTNSPDIDQDDLEESVSIEQSHSTTYPPTCSRTASDGQAREKVSYKRAQEFTNADFPSGSQFNNTRGGGGSKSFTHKSPVAAHIPPPPPPMDIDFMDMDPPLPRTSGVRHPMDSRSSSNRDKDLRITTSTTTEELMDVLFGAENSTDVAEDERVLSKKRDHPGSSRQTVKYHDIQCDKETVTSGVAALPDREHDLHAFPDDFPFEDNITSKVQPLSSSAKITFSDDHSTQDSIINDSGFLPSTPPSKKFKRGSVLFEVDLFGDRQTRTEVLAPDSEEDSD